MTASGKSYSTVRLQLSTFALLIYAANVVSYKDNKSYGTYSNPNTAYSHYWADASNVLDDLTTFRKLYVQYYGCAWSEQAYSSKYQQQQEDHHRSLKDDNKNDRNNNQNAQIKCGQSGGDNSNSWYVGMGSCIGANVAYALYGVLEDDNLARRESPCSKKTFINSFFTTDGLNSFLQATPSSLADLSTTSVSSQCTWYYDETGAKTSYTTTVGCSATGRFTTDIFYGSGCLGYNYYNTTDTLESWNDNLIDAMDCTLIYEQNTDGTVVTDYASDLLGSSEVCSVEGVYKNFCPNPYKIVSTYEYNFAMAQLDSNYTVTKTSFAYLDVVEATNLFRATSSLLMIVVGLILFAGSAWQIILIHIRREKMSPSIVLVEKDYDDHPRGVYQGVLA